MSLSASTTLTQVTIISKKDNIIDSTTANIGWMELVKKTQMVWIQKNTPMEEKEESNETHP